MKEITRREMFKELVSKDTLKMVAGSWYGFTKPLMAGQQVPAGPKKETLADVVKRVNMKYTTVNGKEG